MAKCCFIVTIWLCQKNNVVKKYGTREKFKQLFRLDIKQREGRCCMAAWD